MLSYLSLSMTTYLNNPPKATRDRGPQTGFSDYRLTLRPFKNHFTKQNKLQIT